MPPWGRGRPFGKPTGSEDAPEGRLVQQVHRLEGTAVKHGVVVEHAGKGLGLLQCVHRHQRIRSPGLSTHLPDDLQAVGHIGALVAVVDGQRLCLDDPGPGPVREAGEGAIEGAGQQGVAVIRFVHCLKAVLLGAGRETKESTIDPAAGLRIEKKTGDPVAPGDVLAVLYAEDEAKFAAAEAEYRSALTFGPKAPAPIPLVYALVEKDKVTRIS